MKIIAHRGAPMNAPENTIKSFLLAKAAGSKIFETDVHLSKDGILVVCHDETLLRTAGVGIVIKEAAYADIAKFDVGGGQSAPTLAQLMAALGNKAVLNIEIKTDVVDYPGIEKKVLETIKKMGALWHERAIISSFNFDTLLRVRKLDKKIKIGYLTREFDAKKAKKIGAFSLNISKSRVTKDIVSAAHKAGLEVWVYTVREKKEYAALKKLGADAVFADTPYLK